MVGQRFVKYHSKGKSKGEKAIIVIDSEAINAFTGDVLSRNYPFGKQFT